MKFSLIGCGVNPCSFKEYPNVKACLRITTLKAIEPVKYRIANGYSFGGEYKKSILLAILSSLPSVPIVKLFLEPLLKYARIIFASDTFSRNKLKLFGSSLVNIMSISPDDKAPRR